MRQYKIKYFNNFLVRKIWNTFESVFANSAQSVEHRSSHLQMFFKISVFKNFAIFTARHMYLSLFLIKLQA